MLVRWLYSRLEPFRSNSHHLALRIGSLFRNCVSVFRLSDCIRKLSNVILRLSKDDRPANIAYPSSKPDLPGSNFTRHFTATGFVVHGDSTLLHWHKKVQEWLPPGGHIDDNEDPVQTTLREIKEETGFDAEIVPTQSQVIIGNLEQVTAPHSIMIENVFDKKHGEHQHIDHIYFTRLLTEPTTSTSDLVAHNEHPDTNAGWLWASLSDLENEESFLTPNGDLRTPPEDVIKLGSAAIRHVSSIQ
ncbi:NUDIX domain-containing protein [Candidatus Lucifugimonas marina]|uniref:NUDIX domain-containing protein n=1 Tax=Candidatus Lucifugimonas marina TaxID=3038979 RepID=A0AAJ5ZEX3_9CHLR|nr:NUDIX domain-containing protein [SAR202 cluster bacterium JH702]MDG0870455.1 NUDIX domain-containing protein [SAR202 cluster bacterium JH639]WFG35995.1 NUDIX domain-containing protein [SAR202 cluster bacterium JH545]WFG39939.1 NUDIX domain-containing protein [SAR202 cluster bacterium JH1073]